MYFCLFSYFLFDLWLFQNVLFSFQVFWLFSYLSVIDLYFLFYSVVIREHNLHYVEVCFMAQDMVYLVICCMDTWKECEFCCLGVEYSINTDSILLLMVVLVFSVSLWIFCLAYCWEGNVEVFTYNWICLFFLSILPCFYFTFFQLLVAYTCTVCLGGLSLLTLYNVLLCLWSFSFLRSLLYMTFV